jgi:hypothetical protein
MDNPAGFMEVTVLRDSAIEDVPAEHKATIAVSHIVMMKEEAGEGATPRGTCIVLSETGRSGSWVFGDDETASQPLHRTLLVREPYALVKWLCEKAPVEQRILSSNDWDQSWKDAVKLSRDIEAPQRARFKQKDEE